MTPNLNEIMTSFWKEHEYDNFSTSQIALFFFLLNRVQSRNWVMPVKCSTSYASQMLNISQQSVITSREALQRRGLLKFSKGVGKAEVPLYTLVLDSKEWMEDLSDNLNENFNSELKGKPNKMQNENNKAIFNEKDNDKLKNNKRHGLKDNEATNLNSKINIENAVNINSDITESSILSIEELESKLTDDSKWQSQLISQIRNPELTLEDVKEYLAQFFQYIRRQGTDKRDENDCRNHFFNWLKKHLSTVNQKHSFI